MIDVATFILAVGVTAVAFLAVGLLLSDLPTATTIAFRRGRQAEARARRLRAARRASTAFDDALSVAAPRCTSDERWHA